MATPCRVVVVGAGPAGMVLGLLLARGGVETTVLEKHGDFLRDFRGDTVHASTLTLLDELGLGERFGRLPQRRVEHAEVRLDGGTARVADMRRLPGRHRHIALVPQWDLLEMLARAASEEPTFRLRRHAEVVDLVRERGRVVGVRYRDRAGGPDGDLAGDRDAREPGEHEVRGDLVVACDGRGSVVRERAGLAVRRFGAPMDVEWFRLPRASSDPAGLVGRLSTGRMVVMIDRDSYWQCGYLVRQGGDAELRSQPVDRFAGTLAGLLPWLGGRTGSLSGWDEVSLLRVRLDRVRRWHADGLLVVGDAAHAMSPVGGVGINLAVQDAVATAREVVEAARRASTPEELPGRLRRACRRVQRRRSWPTALVQGAQRVAHRRVISRVLDADAHAAVATRLPPALRLLDRSPRLQSLPARMVAIGPRPEHAPLWARR